MGARSKSLASHDCGVALYARRRSCVPPSWHPRRTNPAGEQYLGRIPEVAHDGLAEIRAPVLRATERALEIVQRGKPGHPATEWRLIRSLRHLPCGTSKALLAS